MLRRDGRFVHEGVLVSHPKLHAAFLKGVRFAEQEGVFIVQIGRFRGQIEVEDTPFWVRSYDPARGEIELSDESVEPIQPESLSIDPDEVLRVLVRGRFPARFTHAAQAHLLDSLEERAGELRLRVGDRWAAIPALAAHLGGA